jgi:hypothetical protein
MRLPEGHSNMANNNPPSLNVDELTAYASAKVKAGVPSQAVREELERMLREDGRSEEETHSVIAEINRRTEVVGGKGSPRQGSPPKNNQEALMAQMLSLMNDMAARMNKLELQRSPAESPSATPALTTTPPTVTYEDVPRRSRLPDPERFNGSRDKYAGWKFECEGKLRCDAAQFPDEDTRKRYILSRTSDKAHETLLSWLLLNDHQPVSALWRHMDKKFQDVHAKDRAADKLRHLKQGRLSVRDYATEFDQLRAQSGLEEDTSVLRGMFREGLSIEVQKHLIGTPEDGTLEELVDRSVQIADQLYRVNRASKLKSSGKFDRGRHSSSARTHDSQSDEMDWEPTRVSRAKPKGNKVRCYTCDEEGHIARNCPKRLRTNKARTTSGKSRGSEGKSVRRSPSPKARVEELSDSDSENE